MKSSLDSEGPLESVNFAAADSAVKRVLSPPSPNQGTFALFVWRDCRHCATMYIDHTLAILLRYCGLLGGIPF